MVSEMTLFEGKLHVWREECLVVNEIIWDNLLVRADLEVR